MRVLAYTQYSDPHITSIAHELEKSGIELISLERYRKDHTLTYDYEEDKAWIQCGREYFPLDENIVAVIWRPKPVIRAEVPGSEGNTTEHLCRAEWKHTAENIANQLTHTLWINDRTKQQKMNNKPYQLKLAKQCDLKIPTTVISNNPNDILPLFNKGEVIYKTVSSFVMLENNIFTTKIEKEEILNDPNSVLMCPGIYQSLIPKQHELRITIVDETLFIAKVNSQKYEATTTDWRKEYHNDLFKPGTLSPETSKKLLQFHRKSGLICAAYDFIIDKHGNEIFLECNPAGQWYWLEKNLGLTISKAISQVILNSIKMR